MIAAVALAAALAAPAQTAGALPGGGTYIVHRDTTARTASIELWFRAPSAGFNYDSPGIARVSLAALAASAPPHGSSLAELVKRDGGALQIAAYTDIEMIGATVPAWQATSIAHAMTATFFAPAVTDSGLRAAVRDSVIVATARQYDAGQVLRDALFARLFSTGPAHYAPVPPPATLAKISAADVRNFAVRAFRQPNAILSIAGNVESGILSSVRTGIAQNTTAEPLVDSTASAGAQATISARVGGLGFAWAGPPISDARAATAMDFIGDYLFDPDAGTLARTMAANSKSTEAPFVDGNYITLHNPGALIVTLEGNVPAGARDQVLQSIAAMKTPLSPAAFTAAKNAFEYHIRQQLETPGGIADNAGWYAAEGNAAYAPGDVSAMYLQALQSLDAGYVASIAAKYLQNPVIVQALTAPQGGTST